MTIQPGQIYRPAKGGPLRIKVVSKPHTTWGLHGYGKVDIVTLTGDGREVRRRPVETSQLHTTPLTANGQPRRTGYVLDSTA
ncbi:MAG TPA: hypothetical protein VF049_22305 [Nocardioidaceae bacterium]